MSQHDPGHDNKPRTKLAWAATTGMIAGVTRAFVDWAIRHLTHNS
ncbi:hypothetical protein [Plantactinospora sp. CA-290183]